MERLTHKIVYDNEHCQYMFDIDQDSEVGTKLGELEDVLEKYDIETTEELDGVLKPLIDNGELENWKSAIFWKMQTERLNNELAELKQTQKQLAIEQLEKLKFKLHTIHTNGYLKAIDEEIDDQIASLKKEGK